MAIYKLPLLNIQRLQYISHDRQKKNCDCGIKTWEVHFSSFLDCFFSLYIFISNLPNNNLKKNLSVSRDDQSPATLLFTNRGKEIIIAKSSRDFY